jgi:peptide/nickel transport system substrate-binding protein
MYREPHRPGVSSSCYVAPRVTRRRVLAIGGAMALGGAALQFAGCDDGDTPAARETPRAGGTLRFGLTTPISYGLDPHLERGGGLPIIARLYGYPFHVDPDTDALLFDHATAVEQPEAGVYVIRLGSHRLHASVASGRTVRSHDVAHSMFRYRDHPFVLNKWWHTKMLAGAGGTDDGTVVLRTQRPYVYSLAEIGDINAGAILPREVIEQQVDLRGADAGSGPLQLGEASIPDRVTLTRFPGYAGERAYVDAMEWRVFASLEEARAALETRAIDVAPLRSRADLDDLSRAGIQAVEEMSRSWYSIGLRVDRPPLSDVRVRRAIDLAVDREELIDQAALGRGAPAGPVSGQLAGGDWALSPAELAVAYESALSREERLTSARQLLAAAGASNIALRLQAADAPELMDLAKVIATQLRGAGMDVSIEALPLVRWFANYRSGDFETTLISHPPFETPDGSLRLYHSLGATGEGNQFGFGDPAIDALIERSWGQADPNARRKTLLEAQRLMLEGRPLIHLFAGSSYTAAHAYVRDSGLALAASLARYHYRQWLDLPVTGRRD